MRDRIAASVHEAGALDRAVYAAIARATTPTLDHTLVALSRAADHSKLWLASAAVLAATGGPAGRRAAVRGLGAIAVASGVVNIGVKLLARRHRPDQSDVPGERRVPMPRSSSFPSGHSASAFAFATAAGHGAVAVDLPLRILATAVAYSRIHTGVHYPSDVIVGGLIGSAAGEAVAAIGR
jgi:membrane-associated phospholipid phosphatase